MVCFALLSVGLSSTFDSHKQHKETKINLSLGLGYYGTVMVWYGMVWFGLVLFSSFCSDCYFGSFGSLSATLCHVDHLQEHHLMAGLVMVWRGMVSGTS
jgi:hypothetical protein